MKLISSIVCKSALFLILISPMGLRAQYVGYKLSLGWDGGITNTLVNGSAANGQYNLFSSEGYNSLAVGEHNTLNNDSSFVLGVVNELAGSGGGNIVGGAGNYLDSGVFNLVIGQDNIISNSGSGSWGSMIVGYLNSTSGISNSLVSGTTNAVASFSSGGAIGTGLIAQNESNHFIIGKYNVQAVSTRPELFTVANGTSPASAARSNALVVYKNGDVIIKKAQGDILMGEFGN